MFQKILVAVDLSSRAEIVFDRALNLAKSSGASLILLHVLSSDEPDAPDPLVYSVQYPINRTVVEQHQTEWLDYQKKGMLTLEAMQKKAIERSVKAETIQLFGRPGWIVCDRAKELAVDLIIMGSRGLSGLKELFVGSVSNYVLHHAPCSVLIVRPQSH